MFSNPFVKQDLSQREKYSIATLFGTSKKTGQVGIEIEVEGNKFPKVYDDGSGEGSEYIPSYWRYTHDGSLRGQDNAEYVLQNPIMFQEVPEAVNSLWQMFDEYGSVLDESNRTSVHVHLNVQDFQLNRLAAFSALYFCFEDLLTHWCGDHRVGNLFCLRAKDAPAIISKLKRLIITTDPRHVKSDSGLHYAAFNTQALAKFGSVEIRTLRGATDPGTVITWVEILQRIYELSEFHAKDPTKVTEGFSGQPIEAFLEGVFGHLTNTILEGSGLAMSQIHSSVHEGVRIAQNIAHCRDWSRFPSEMKPADPFGRGIESLQHYEQAEQAIIASAGYSAPLTMDFVVPGPTHNLSISSLPVDLSEEDFYEQEESDYDE